MFHQENDPHADSSPNKPEGSRSRTEWAYKTLKHEILAGRLGPSIRLNIGELSERLSVSPGAVREALARLTSDDLVRALPHSGFSVAPISVDELRDLTDVRVQIEQACLRRCLKYAGVEWEANLIAAAHRLNHMPFTLTTSATVNDEWSLIHQRYHEALVSACDSPWLLRVRNALFLQSERYRRLSTSRNAEVEHQQIVEAALARNVEQVLRLMHEHLWKTTEALIEMTADTEKESSSLRSPSSAERTRK